MKKIRQSNGNVAMRKEMYGSLHFKLFLWSVSSSPQLTMLYRKRSFQAVGRCPYVVVVETFEGFSPFLLPWIGRTHLQKSPMIAICNFLILSTLVSVS